MSAPLTLDHIHKSFDKRTILDGISLSLEKGEIFGLIGLNGIGKTTLIKIILDLLKSDKGTISFFGTSSLKPSSRRHVYYLPEKFSPSPLLTGYEFLRLSLFHYGRTANKAAIIEGAESLHLDPAALSRKITTYSKGMGQKLGLLSAFLAETPLLILDEPMSGLDPLARVALKNKLSAYSEAGGTVFFSSHILADIEEIAHRISVLHNGHILFTGTVGAFTDAYPEPTLESAFLKSIKS